jgi:hypothetical protein
LEHLPQDFEPFPFVIDKRHFILAPSRLLHTGFGQFCQLVRCVRISDSDGVVNSLASNHL